MCDIVVISSLCITNLYVYTVQNKWMTDSCRLGWKTMQILLVGAAIHFCVSQLLGFPVHANHSQRVKRWIELENITFTFDCTNRAIGFYADVEYNCQIFHMCNEEKRRVPHVCANDTSFNQEYRICDWEYNFNCSDAPKWYYLNELTYATDSPNEDY